MATFHFMPDLLVTRTFTICITVMLFSLLRATLQCLQAVERDALMMACTTATPPMMQHCRSGPTCCAQASEEEVVRSCR